MDLYSETLSKIYNLRGGIIDLRLDRMEQTLSLFDHPEKKFASFHIAGTNGKGSTAAMLHRVLTAAGYKTALYISPHLVSFAERIRIADEEITPGEVVSLADEIWERTTVARIPLTFFEFVTVMAFVYFARKAIDVGVVEVGLGGRLDATNLVRPVATMVTTISKDHEAYLGSDLVSIAREKGGIIKRGVPVVCGALSPDALDAVGQIAVKNESPFYALERNFNCCLKVDGTFDYKGPNWCFKELSVGLRGNHQRRNAAVAVAALEVARRQFPVSEWAVREGLRTVFWPGRLEVMLQEPMVILDGAHNGEGVKALVNELHSLRVRGQVKMMFAAMEDKDWRLMLDRLSAAVDEIVLTRVNMERSADPQQLAAHLGGKISHCVMADSRSGLGFLLDNALPDDVIVVAGSLYLLGEVRPMLETLAKQRLIQEKALSPVP
jgi:dihydrofolate synthase/folylpolyglutamate synthase